MLYLIAIGIIVLIFLVLSLRKKGETKQISPAQRIEEFEIKATYFFGILKEESKSKVWVDRTPDWMLRMVSLTEHWYLQLKERDKHNPDKALEHARDWYDFVYQTWEAKCYGTQEALGSNDNQSIDERIDEERKLWIPIHEIRKRIAKELNLDFEKIMKKENEAFDAEQKTSDERIEQILKKNRDKKK